MKVSCNIPISFLVVSLSRVSDLIPGVRFSPPQRLLLVNNSERENGGVVNGSPGNDGASVCFSSGAPSEKILAKHLKYHFLLSKIVSELCKGIFV